MSVTIKTQHEIELMREAGHLLEKVHDGLIPYIKPGVSTKEIDKIGEEMIRSMGCIPNFLNYGGFPASTLISNSVGSALSSVPLGPFTVTTFPSATVTSTPAGIATGSLPIRDINLSSLLRLSERAGALSVFSLKAI